ncbi:hypothetical protein RJ55_02909 [Drechmeria coniospora]|nr:hypothetical protein RJ55_02909 [Drechmeria coniospora]
MRFTSTAVVLRDVAGGAEECLRETVVLWGAADAARASLSLGNGQGLVPLPPVRFHVTSPVPECRGPSICTCHPAAPNRARAQCKGTRCSRNRGASVQYVRSVRAPLSRAVWLDARRHRTGARQWSPRRRIPLVRSPASMEYSSGPRQTTGTTLSHHPASQLLSIRPGRGQPDSAAGHSSRPLVTGAMEPEGPHPLPSPPLPSLPPSVEVT